jgi:GMP synthase (glutamine-hydrolysing)
MIKQGKIIEPIKELYKDEVRDLGIELGLPNDLIYRHPFPGPGLSVRCLCLEKEYYPESKETLQKEINEYLKNYDLSSLVLPIRSVGVQGDSRTYRNPLLLTGANLTGARGNDFKYNELGKISTFITNNFQEINRVVFLLNPEQIEFNNIKTKKCYLTRERINLLQEADDIATASLKKYKLYDQVWQMPVVLLPLAVNGRECIVLRPVNSKEAMTAEFSRLPYALLKEISSEIMKLDIGAVFYDITNKPPGTIEWE